MISRAVEAEVLRLHHAERWPIGTIARQLMLHHSTVRRVLAQAGVPEAQKSTRPSIADPFLPFMLETLKAYPKLCASRLHIMVRDRGYRGGSDHFRAIVARLRPRPVPEAYLRLRTLPGQQAQCDWALCRSRHRAHYAEFRTTPSWAIACLFRTFLIENYSA